MGDKNQLTELLGVVLQNTQGENKPNRYPESDSRQQTQKF